MTSNIKQQVRQFILDNFLMAETADLPDDASFIDRHVIDSTGFLELVSFIEQTFNVEVADDEMVPENLDSLNNIEVCPGDGPGALPGALSHLRLDLTQ